MCILQPIREHSSWYKFEDFFEIQESLINLSDLPEALQLEPKVISKSIFRNHHWYGFYCLYSSCVYKYKVLVLWIWISYPVVVLVFLNPGKEFHDNVIWHAIIKSLNLKVRNHDHAILMGPFNFLQTTKLIFIVHKSYFN